MALSVAIQMDPIESIDIDADSTFALALEGQKRGHALSYYQPQQLALSGGRLFATVRTLEVWRRKGDHHRLGPPKRIDLATVDVVLMRQDPPFDLAYISATHLLEHVAATTLVVNDPVAVRNAPEKLLVTHFPDLAPPTLISADKGEIAQFRAEHGEIVLKPLYGNGGAGVFHVKADDDNFNAMVEMYALRSREPIVAQRYLPAVRNGDKRIILIDGEVAGAINRVPKQGEARSNMHVGGKAEKSTLTPREKAICAAIGPVLRRQGLVFVGIDVIGDYLTEINVTSPTGIQEIDRFDGTNLAALVWDAVEARRSAQIAQRTTPR